MLDLKGNRPLSRGYCAVSGQAHDAYLTRMFLLYDAASELMLVAVDSAQTV